MLRKLLVLALAASFAVLAMGADSCSTEEGGGGSDSGESSDNSKSSGSGGGEKKKPCGNRATDDCTPTVGPNGHVRVDALIWSVESVRTAKTIGDQQYGFGEKADDTFLIVNIKVHSDKNESATLSDDSIKLQGRNGNTYDADSEGTIAAVGAGEDPLFFEDIGPDQTTRSKVVFDVPQKVLRGGAKLRFNELGLGETHGYIQLPNVP